MGKETLDTRLLAQLVEQSEDLHSDAQRVTRASLDEFGAYRAAVTPDDIKALQTAASIENLAVAAYTAAIGLPFIQTGNPIILAFVTRTAQQHQAHAQAFNAAAVKAGGQAQTAPDPKYAAVLQQAQPTIQGPADVVKLGVTLEDVAAQTYTKYVSTVTDPDLRHLFGSVAPVEAQHLAVLLAIQTVLQNGTPELIALPPDLAKLPAAAGNAGFPYTFMPTEKASPIDEGAVK
ncbi:ferritin-like domain-containing protein [Yinghuangia seranimata]|uniref:ferritin-like domain-containing protein n=1 Tax=Yinghuangia seranimata TaxID=408067 RepID=UPI00248B1852|nr:ferritin-like domain-containing protein [Yinghuangia seranimata]MDI2129617.1 ferritin-like domain-containing protein [Yinghuangia seranimata]